VLGVSTCEQTYYDSFFVHYSCQGADFGGLASACESCSIFFTLLFSSFLFSSVLFCSLLFFSLLFFSFLFCSLLLSLLLLPPIPPPLPPSSPTPLCLLLHIISLANKQWHYVHSRRSDIPDHLHHGLLCDGLPSQQPTPIHACAATGLCLVYIYMYCTSFHCNCSCNFVSHLE
jgi:hypothetical protein